MVRELIQYIAEHLVDEPEKVQVTQVEGERSMVVELRVASGDMGKVIGRNGRIAKAMRTVAKAASTPGTKGVHVEILD